MEYSTYPETVQQSPIESGLEVAPPSRLHGIEVASPSGLHVVEKALPPVEPHDIAESHDIAGSKPRLRRILYILIGLALVVIAAVLGGVLGSRATHHSSKSTPTSTTSTTPSSTSLLPTPTSIDANSPLSAVSFHTTVDGSPSGQITGSVVVIGFKGQDGKLKASIFNSGWQNTPQLITATSPAENDTGLAIAGYDLLTEQKNGNTSSPEYNLVLIMLYINTTGYINGLNYIATAAANGIGPQEINNRGYNVRTGSNVAAYWPWLIFQDWSGFINVAKSLAKPAYSETQLRVTTQQGTKFSVVPLSTDFAKVNDSSYGIFYQDSSGKLAAVTPGIYTGGSGYITQSWPSISQFPDISIPSGASFSALSFARESDPKIDTVNTFVLYQDETAQIKQVWTDDGKTWKQSSPPALAKADNGTDISCLTPAAMNNTNGPPLYVAPQSSLTRCYFQRGGWVVEVQLNGTDWFELGTIPMP